MSLAVVFDDEGLGAFELVEGGRGVALQQSQVGQLELDE